MITNFVLHWWQKRLRHLWNELPKTYMKNINSITWHRTQSTQFFTSIILSQKGWGFKEIAPIISQEQCSWTPVFETFSSVLCFITPFKWQNGLSSCFLHWIPWQFFNLSNNSWRKLVKEKYYGGNAKLKKSNMPTKPSYPSILLEILATKGYQNAST